jgi:uncharacterized protein YjbI with pentapeptide repeats
MPSDYVGIVQLSNSNFINLPCFLNRRLFNVRRFALDGLDKLACVFHFASFSTEDQSDTPFRTADTTGATLESVNSGQDFNGLQFRYDLTRE